jgi:hypothetical protein
MTKQEYRDLVKANTRILYVYVAVLIALNFVPLMFVSSLDIGDAIRCIVALLLVGLTVTAAMLIHITYHANRNGLRCPHCNAYLIPVGASYIVIASGNCPQCGEQVLE